MWTWIALATAKEPKAPKAPAPAKAGVTLVSGTGPVALPHAVAFRRPGATVVTISVSADPFTCDEVRQEGSPPGSFAQFDVGTALEADGTEPWRVLGTYLAHGGGSGWSSEDGPPITWAGGVATWTAPIPLPLEATIAPGTVKPADCGEVPLVTDPPVFAASKTATWRVAGKPLVVGGARLRADGTLDLSTDGASCAWNGVADVTLAISADGTSVELGGGRLPTLFASAPEPGPLAWTAPPKSGDRVTVPLSGKFVLDNGYAIELGGTVDAFDCRE